MFTVMHAKRLTKYPIHLVKKIHDLSKKTINKQKTHQTREVSHRTRMNYKTSKKSHIYNEPTYNQTMLSNKKHAYSKRSEKQNWNTKWKLVVKKKKINKIQQIQTKTTTTTTTKQTLQTDITAIET